MSTLDLYMELHKTLFHLFVWYTTEFILINLNFLQFCNAYLICLTNQRRIVLASANLIIEIQSFSKVCYSAESFRKEELNSLFFLFTNWHTFTNFFTRIETFFMFLWNIFIPIHITFGFNRGPRPEVTLSICHAFCSTCHPTCSIYCICFISKCYSIFYILAFYEWNELILNDINVFITSQSSFCR